MDEKRELDIKSFKSSLENKIKNSDNVFVVPHIMPDCDAIGAAIGVYVISRSLKKETYIVVNDPSFSIEAGVKMIMSELPDYIKFINHEEAKKLKKPGTLMICTDVNKLNLIPFDRVDCYSDIAIIDHHKVDENTIKTNVKYIDTSSSSACEITYRLLNAFNLRTDGGIDHNNSCYVPNLPNYLLSGIFLDTSKLTKNVSPLTMSIAAKLMKKGASMDYVNNLFLEDFENDMVIQNLVSNTVWDMYSIGIAMDNDNPNKIYTKEILAKVADCLLKYRVDAAFALGFIDENVVGVSARSKGNIDVGEILSYLGGGGNETSAATRIETDDIEGVKLTLKKICKPGVSLNSTDIKRLK